ncbi:hypothetical protein RDWZM_010554 [Blomia tropicalis]|uniref:RRM domain-containing protein n=1 Tax=Blomia tropicalis TaxID=40697 RepID=A0A9Q0RIT4_BLOTA|nr:hypothetical protein RDWZM_010554 [Blomia tropicalis]
MCQLKSSSKHSLQDGMNDDDDTNRPSSLMTVSKHNNNNKKHRVRKRKRNLYRKIREQIGYCFSDANMRHDQLMRQETSVVEENVASEQYELAWANTSLENAKPFYLSGTRPITIRQLLTFRNISKLTKCESDIFNALKFQPNWHCHCIDLHFDIESRTVSRCQPFFSGTCSSKNQRMIYVENFLQLHLKNPRKWLMNIFKQFGMIISIHLAQYQKSSELIGYCFIEYKEIDSVEKVEIFLVHLMHNQTENDLNKIKNSLNDNAIKPSTKQVRFENKEKNANNSTVLQESMSDLKKLRVMSKQRWIQYRNRYQKLQKQAQKYSLSLIEKRNSFKITILESLNLDQKTPVNNSYPVNCKDKSLNMDNERHSNQCNIIQIELSSHELNDFDRAELCDKFCNIFAKPFHDGTMPSKDDISCIDIRHRNIRLDSDSGQLIQTIYIRTVQPEMATYLVSNDFICKFQKSLPKRVKVTKVIKLDPLAVSGYWTLLNMKSDTKPIAKPKN